VDREREDRERDGQNGGERAVSDARGRSGGGGGRGRGGVPAMLRSGWVTLVLALLPIALTTALAATALADRDTSPPAFASEATWWAEGHARGVVDGRVLQGSMPLAPSERAAVGQAFRNGYAAGQTDAFGGYDGGWTIGDPYVVTLRAGGSGITYRFASRTPMVKGQAYYRCRGAGICTMPAP
jgi:hypothetical protein